MRPPECAVCGRDARDTDEAGPLDFDTVTFADYEPLPDGMVGHPRGVEWFCPAHLAPARRLAHLNSVAAIEQVRRGN